MQHEKSALKIRSWKTFSGIIYVLSLFWEDKQFISSVFFFNPLLSLALLCVSHAFSLITPLRERMQHLNQTHISVLQFSCIWRGKTFSLWLLYALGITATFSRMQHAHFMSYKRRLLVRLCEADFTSNWSRAERVKEAASTCSNGTCHTSEGKHILPNEKLAGCLRRK